MDKRDLCDVLKIENLSFPNPWRESTFQGEVDNYLISFPYVIAHSVKKNVIGYIIFWHVEEEVQISNFAVHPDFRRMGIGEEVMRQMLERIVRRGAKYIVLEVRPSNIAARSLYGKFGFKIWGVGKNYYRNPSEDAIIMGKIL